MKRLLFALLFVVGLSGVLQAQTCTMRPQSLSSNHSVGCSLPALQTNQCVHYVFSFQATNVPVDVLNVQLNTSVINAVITQSGTLSGNYSLEGRFCAAEDGSQWFINPPVFNMTDGVSSILTGPTSGSVTEDTLTQTSVLSLFYSAGRGWGIIFSGGVANVETIPPPLP